MTTASIWLYLISVRFVLGPADD